MRPNRTIIVIAAVVAALLAGTAASAFLSGSDRRAYKGATLVKVYKVVKDVPKGFSGDDAIASEKVKPDQIPQEFRPGTALTDINALRGKVALTNLSANQVLVDGMFVDPRVAQVTAAQRVPSGQVAVTVSVDQVHGVAGLLVPGDKVNVMVAGTDGSERTLYQNVSILYIGGTAAPQAGDTTAVTAPTAGTNLITFAVPQDAANRIVLAANAPGGLYLSLVPPDYQPTSITPANPGNLFNTPLTPYGP